MNAHFQQSILKKKKKKCEEKPGSSAVITNIFSDLFSSFPAGEKMVPCEEDIHASGPAPLINF